MNAAFIQRPNSTDHDVIREIWEENVYHLTENDFSGCGVVVDIGANIGAFALYAATLGASRIVAYEPEPENYQVLIENMRANSELAKAIEAECAAVWSHSCCLAVHSAQGNSTVSESLNGAFNCGDAQALSLDELFIKHRIEECAVLKLDVEGSEYPILLFAASSTLERCRRIVLEFHPARDDVFGRLLAHLTRTHKFYVLGSIDRGGYIWAERY